MRCLSREGRRTQGKSSVYATNAVEAHTAKAVSYLAVRAEFEVVHSTTVTCCPIEPRLCRHQGCHRLLQAVTAAASRFLVFSLSLLARLVSFSFLLLSPLLCVLPLLAFARVCSRLLIDPRSSSVLFSYMPSSSVHQCCHHAAARFKLQQASHHAGPFRARLSPTCRTLQLWHLKFTLHATPAPTL